jgi:hypothetical protein
MEMLPDQAAAEVGGRLCRNRCRMALGKKPLKLRTASIELS